MCRCFMAPIMKDSYINISLAFHACGDCTDVDICVIDHILGLLIFLLTLPPGKHPDFYVQTLCRVIRLQRHKQCELNKFFSV